jgi:hypothetical protein
MSDAGLLGASGAVGGRQGWWFSGCCEMMKGKSAAKDELILGIQSVNKHGQWQEDLPMIEKAVAHKFAFVDQADVMSVRSEGRNRHKHRLPGDGTELMELFGAAPRKS